MRLLAPVFALVALAGCTLTFTPELFQTLRLFFEIGSDLPQGEATVVQTLDFPAEVRLKKRFLRLSGNLDGAPPPDRLLLVAESVDSTTGAKRGSIKMTIKIDDQGNFNALKKLKKNVSAGTTMTVTVEPVGGDLQAGTPISVCVDVLQRRGDAADSVCTTEAPPTGPSTFTAIQDQVFTPSCALAGCHDASSAREGLVLEAGMAYSNLVNVPSNQSPIRLRVDPGNPDDSYLIKKLRGSSDISGVRMPSGAPALSDSQLAGIEAWIRSGALEN